jgi:hypothetical protein
MLDWIKAHIIDDWPHGWTFYTNWFYGTGIALPQLYNLLAASGHLGGDTPLPGWLKWCLSTAGVLGILLRFVKQHKPDAPRPV